MRSRICPRLLCGLLLALAAPATTRAQKSDAERARQAYADGEAAYRLDRFDEAAKRYEEAYRLSKYPTILFDIAQCHRRQYETDRTLDHLRKAIDLYRAFLRDAPTASKRPVAARLVPELEKTLAAETRRRRQELIAKANGAEGLKLAEQLVAEGQTQDAAMVLDRVIAARGNPHEVIVVAFGRRAVVAGLLGQKDVAIEAFKRALTLDPGLAPPGGADRATQEAYQAAKQVLAGKRPLTLSQVPPGDVQPGQPARIGVAVESDPVQMVEQVAVFYRLGGSGAYSVSRAKKDAGVIEIPGAFLSGMPGGSRVEYYVAALDAFEGQLVTLGTPSDPFVFAVGRPPEPVGAAADSGPPWYRKWWVWAIVGGVAAGGGAGAYLATRSGPNNPPPVPLPTP